MRARDRSDHRDHGGEAKPHQNPHYNLELTTDGRERRELYTLSRRKQVERRYLDARWQLCASGTSTEGFADNQNRLDSVSDEDLELEANQAVKSGDKL
jgi:hypothetical protein